MPWRQTKSFSDATISTHVVHGRNNKTDINYNNLSFSFQNSLFKENINAKR